MRLEIHVRPNASATVVGGMHDGALVVRVTDPAAHGRATAAALRAVADALALPSRSVTLVRGATSRRKVIDVAADGPARPAVEARVAQLLGR